MISDQNQRVPDFLTTPNPRNDHVLQGRWEETPLGDVHQWPDDLVVALGMVLNNDDPKILCWGNDAICVYNEAYERLVGARAARKILGLPLREALPELWMKLPKQMHSNGDPSENIRIEISDKGENRSDDDFETTYICHPVLNAKGKKAGILIRVRRSEYQASDGGDPDKKLFQQFIKEAPVGILVLSGFDFRITVANSNFAQLTGRSEDMILHQKFFDVYPLLQKEFASILENVLRSGESFYGDEVMIRTSLDDSEKFIYVNIVLQPMKAEDGRINSLMAIIVDVTGIARQKRLLAANQRKFKTLVETSRIGTLQIANDLTVEYANDLVYKEIFQIRPEAMIGRKLDELIPMPENEGFLHEVQLVITSGITLQKKDACLVLGVGNRSSEWFFDYEISTLTEPQNGGASVIIRLYDVTDKVGARRAQADSQRRLEMSLEAGGLALWEIDLPTRKMTFSTRMGHILGVDTSAEYSIGLLRTFVHPDHQQELTATYEQALKSGEYFFEGKFIRSDASIGWLRIRGKVFFDKNGVPAKMMGTTRDITKEKKRHIDLQRKEYRLRNLILQAPVAIGILRGPDCKVEIVNDAACALLGKSREDLEGKPILDTMTEVDSTIARSLFDRVYFDGRTISENEYPVRFVRNGKSEKIYVNFEYDPLKNSDGKIIGIMVVGTEVTSQVRSRKQIEESEHRFRLLANTVPAFVCSVGMNDEVDFVNDTFQRYTGLNREDVIRLSIFSTVHLDDAPKALEKWEKSWNTLSEFIDEHRIRKHDGTYRWFLTRAAPEWERPFGPSRWIVTSTDIQEIKEQELQKDYFISRASHELKTPITSLKGYIQILQHLDIEENDEMMNHSLTRMQIQVNKLNRLIDDLLDTTRIGNKGFSIHKEYCNLCELITEVVEEINTVSDFTIAFDQSECDVTILADRQKIGQTISNLLTNAIKYSPDGDTVWIETHRNGNKITICVIDHGIGIDKSLQQKIFEKFYRVMGKNEETYPGFGIGLFIANEILKAHGTELRVDSEPGRGSSFCFELEFTDP